MTHDHDTNYRSKWILMPALVIFLIASALIVFSSVTVHADTPITGVSISGISDPVAGNTPPAINSSYVKSAHSSIDEINSYWVYDVGGMWYKYKEPKFQSGKVYAVYFHVIADSGYKFSDSCKVVVNGNTLSEIEMNTGSDLRFIYVFAKGDTVISNINITGVQDPVEGDTPKYNGISAPSPVAIDKSNTLWQYFMSETNAWHAMPASQKFEQGVTYRLQLQLTVPSGYSFADNVAVTINGKPVESATRSKDNIRQFGVVSADVSAQDLTPSPSTAVYIVSKDKAEAFATRNEKQQSWNLLGFGFIVEVDSMVGDWVGFKLFDSPMWIRREYLARAYSAETAQAGYCTVTAGSVNIRSEMSISSTRLGGLSKDDRVLTTGLLTGDDGTEWYVIDHNGDPGFVMAKYLHPEPVAIEAFSFSKIPALVNSRSSADPMVVDCGSGEAIDTNICDLGDGGLSIRLVPAEGYMLSKLDPSNVSLPAGSGYILTGVYYDAGNGSVDVRFKNTWTYDTGKAMKVLSPTLKAGKKKVTVKWKKDSNASGYQIRYSYSKDMSSVKTIKVKGAKKTSRVIKKLKKGKKVYVQIRPYVEHNGKTYYGLLGAKKSVKVK